MPSAPQTMVNPKPTDEKMVPFDINAPGGGSSVSTEKMKAIFPFSPIYAKKISDQERKAFYQENVLTGEINDGGYYFSSFNTSFSGDGKAPDYAAVETGAGGWPASPWVPNPVSPGPGNMNPTSLPDPPPDFGQTPNDQFGDGFAVTDSNRNPSTTSELISDQKMGDYVLEPLSKAYVVG